MSVKLESSWINLLADQFQLPYFSALKATLEQERQQGIVHYPPASKIFQALDWCTVKNTRVVILGQDPYHNPGQAHGLSFSVPKGTPIPPSLLNIYKEIEDDLNLPIPQHGNLEYWAKQGVLLLNASLTVRAHQAASHAQIGWLTFTDTLIQRLSQEHQGIAFMLWGNFARAKKTLINPTGKHLILESAHPSPLSAYKGFLGCRHFSLANDFLQAQGLSKIDWSNP